MIIRSIKAFVLFFVFSVLFLAESIAIPRYLPTSSITVPEPEAKLTSAEQVFMWESTENISLWWLYVGTYSNGNDIYDSGLLSNTTSHSVSNLPIDGTVIFVTLWLRESATAPWRAIRTHYTAAIGDFQAEPAISSPASGDRITPGMTSFDWNRNETIPDAWWIDVGSESKISDIYSSGMIDAQSDSLEIPLPDDSPIYLKFWYKTAGTWHRKIYFYRTLPQAAPFVNADPFLQIITLPNASLTVSADVRDDGLPSEYSLSYEWVAINDADKVIFDDPYAASTRVSFSEVGEYTLKIIADDGELSSSDTTVVRVIPLIGTPQALFKFQHSGGEPLVTSFFVFGLNDPAKIAQARTILATGDPKLILGNIVKTRASSYSNSPWSFQLEPDSIGFADFAVEVCDGDMPPIEAQLELIGGAYMPESVWCPWDSRLVEEISLPK